MTTQQIPPAAGRKIFHLLPNAHLDPVWLWDWREGLGEGLTTVRTILDLMEEFPELTFFRGESAIYEYIEKADPRTFQRIRQAVESDRWDVVGGTHVQPDSNLASTEALCRQYEVGLKYFAERFGRAPRVAWQADSFGHTPGFPEILSSFGMENFAFTRPQRSEFPMQSPAFWWSGRGGKKILCYRQHWLWYCSERFNLAKILDETLRLSADQPFLHVGVLMGLGNHGGGPSRRHIMDARAWGGTHPEIELRYSTLHGFFDALRGEIPGLPEPAVPLHVGDMGYCLRGCYSSALRLKSAHRRSESALAAAEATRAAVDAGLASPGGADLDDEWKGVLFNTFHDILPGSSIERALDDQIALAGHIVRKSQEVTFEAMTRLGRHVDTSVSPPPDPDSPRDVAILVWNPLPRAFEGWFELEASLDYRPFHGLSAEIGSMRLILEGPGGELPAFQEIATEHHSMRDAAWRKRVVLRSEIPPFGWKVFRLGCRKPAPESGALAASAMQASAGRSIQQGPWRVDVTPEKQVKIYFEDRPFFAGDGAMELHTIEDIWGSWGGMGEEKNAILTDNILHRWEVSDSAVLESGPERAALWTRWSGGGSWLELTYFLTRGSGEVRVSGRMLWNERSSRLKLVLPSSGVLEMQVPAGVAERADSGHLPCGRWVRRGNDKGAIGFVSEFFSDVDVTDSALQVSLVRASRYADDVPTPADVRPWEPAMDLGEFKFQFLLAPGTSDLERLAGDLLTPPVALCVDPHSGTLPACGSFGSIEPSHASLLALRHLGGSRFSVRIQNLSDNSSEVAIQLGNKSIPLGIFAPWEIRTSEISLHSS
ncbi:MAG: hypothetical protein WCO94_07755 [Verrucomicrobiota bacterium]